MLAGLIDPSLTTERLYLRPPRPGDYEPWARLREDSRDHLQRFEPEWPQDALSRLDWSRRMRHWRRLQKEGAGFVFFVFLRSNLTLAGGVSLNSIRRGSAQTASLGYWLGEMFIGGGVMTEAVVRVSRWAFFELGLERLEAGTVPENERSAAVLLRAGFNEEGYARDYLEIAGRRRDHRLFGLVRRDMTG